MCDAVTQFNDGEKGRKRLYKTLNLNVGINAIKGLQREEKNRLRKASAKVTEKYRKCRQALRSIRKNKNKNKHKSYIAGSFTYKVVPDIDFSNQLTSNDSINVPVFFVDDMNIVMITLINK